MKNLQLALILLVFGYAVNAQTNTGSEPPFMAHSTGFLMTLFNLKSETVQSILPCAVKPKINDAGLVTAGIELYQTDRAQGIPNYGIVFIFVEVVGLQSNNGTPGHWVIWGRVNEEIALKSMVGYFNFPYQFGDVSITKNQEVYTGIVEGGKIRLQVKYLEQSPFGGEGIVNMCSLSKEGKVLKSEVPWFSSGSRGELIEFKINPHGDKILEAIKGFTPFFSMVSVNQTFSYSRVVQK